MQLTEERLGINLVFLPLVHFWRKNLSYQALFFLLPTTATAGYMDIFVIIRIEKYVMGTASTWRMVDQDQEQSNQIGLP